MTHPYQMIIENGSVAEALRLTTNFDRSELAQAGESLVPEELDRLQKSTASAIVKTGVQATLYLGGLLYVFKSATQGENRSGRFGQLIEELGIGKTTAYDAIAVFDCFGKTLFESTELMQRFPVAALTKLASVSTPPAAREEAIAMARQGQRITIKKTEELLTGYTVGGEPIHEPDSSTAEKPAEKPAEKAAPKPAKKRPAFETNEVFWSYSGDEAEIVITTTARAGELDRPAVLRDLEAAVERFRRELETSDDDPNQTLAA